ncbi:unnamed protein product [Closterium sp. Naga37s-1]|nr:unnamed protein product [Closterium sp. Naga37s-1]
MEVAWERGAMVPGRPAEGSFSSTAAHTAAVACYFCSLPAPCPSLQSLVFSCHSCHGATTAAAGAVAVTFSDPPTPPQSPQAGEAARPAGCSMVSLSLIALRPSAFTIQQHGIAHLHPHERPETASQQQRICLCHLTPHTLLLTIYFHRAENKNPSAFFQLPPLLHFPLPPSSSPSVHIQLDLPNPSRPSPLVLSPIPPPPPPPRLSSHPLLSPSPFATSSFPLLLSPLLSPSPPSPTPLSHILPCSTPPSHENNTTLHTSAYPSAPTATCHTTPNERS